MYIYIQANMFPLNINADLVKSRYAIELVSSTYQGCLRDLY